MNANVSPDDESVDPIHLCPIDLQKLQHAYLFKLFLFFSQLLFYFYFFCSIGFDALRRYTDLLKFYTKKNWQKEVEWLTKRIRQLNSS